MGYMESAIPVAADFDAVEMSAFRSTIDHPVQLHRKLWEWAFIYHHLKNEGKLEPGMRGLGFGVDLERLPSAFAARGCNIVATDSPPDIGAHWHKKEHSNDKTRLFYEKIVDKRVFERAVSFQICDMNDIRRDLVDFDFCWSACAMEHLGDLELGMRFVINSLTALQVGGIAVHTTEFNLSSDTETISEGETAIYRRSDIDNLHKALVAAGHRVRPIPISVGKTALDSHVDVPPYTHNPHLKLQLMNFVRTSIGIVVERGR